MQKLFSILILIFFITRVNAQQLYLQTYSVNDGLPGNSIRKIYQDSEGFIWLATMNGLSCYDGYRFTNYGPDKGIFSVVNDVIEIEKGKLLVAQNNGDVSIVENNVAKKIYSGGIVINLFIPQKDNKLLILTDGNGVCEWKNNKVSVLPRSPVTNVHRIAFVNDSMYLYGDVNNGKVLITDKNFYPYSKITDCKFLSVFTDSHKKTLVGTFTGLKQVAVFQKKNTQVSFLPLPAALNIPILTNSAIWEMYEDKKHNLWFGTNHGVVSVNPAGSATVINTINGLPANLVNCIFEDREQNIWIGTVMGLVKLSLKNKVNKYGIMQGLLSDELFYAQSVADDKVILFGNTLQKLNPATGLISTFKNNKQDIPSKYLKVDTNEIMEIQQDKIISYKKGIISRVKIKWPPGFLPRQAYRINSKIFFLSDNNKRSVIATSNSYFSDSSALPYIFTAITKDQLENLWIGTWENGLYKIKINEDMSFTVIDSLTGQLPDQHIRSLFIDSDNCLWIGTRYGGLCKLSGADSGKHHVTFYQENDGLSDNWIRCIKEDSHKNIWIGTMDGLNKLIPVKTSYRIFNFSRISNLTMQIYDIENLTDGSLVCAGYPYAIHIIDAQPDTLPPPQVHFTSVNVGSGGNPVSVNQNKSITRIAYKKAQILFEFSSASFINEKKILYSYRLLGSNDTSWSIPASIHVVNYSNLQSGSYTFQVRTLGWNGEWGQPTGFSFIVSTPFWKTSWFFISIALLIAAIVYTLYHYRLRQLIKLQQVRNRIATDLHDDIGSSLTNISILAELAQKKSDVPDQARVFMKRISEEINESGQSLDDIIWSVNSKNDTTEEMLVRMRRFAAELFDSSQIQYHLQLEEEAKTQKLNMEQRRDVYLIYKESLNNIYKHAAATNVWIQVKTEGQQLSMEIRDDGKGFDTGLLTHRNGLKNMEMRVNKWKGKFRLVSVKGTGTQIYITMPIQN